MSLSYSAKLYHVAHERARQLRKQLTPRERTLWQALRGRKLEGYEFLRQHPILGDVNGRESFVVVDFFCAEAKLIVEIDGTVHENQQEQDGARDLATSLRGYRVLHEIIIKFTMSLRTHLYTFFSLAFLLTSCTPRNHGATELVFWAFGAEGEHVAKMMPGFEARHPQIHVRVQMIPWNAAHEKLLTAYAGQSLPDMCQLGNTWIPEFAVLNALEPLAPWVARSTTVHDSSFFPGIWDTNLIDSVLYGVPWYVDTRVMFYRKDLFELVGYPGPPRSWDEWFDVSARLKARFPGQYAILLPTNNEFAPPVIMGLQEGSTLLKDKNTRGDFSGKEFVEAMHAFHRFFENGWAPARPTQIVNVYQSFAEGYYAMYITGPWNIGEFKRRLPDTLQDAWMTAPLPGPRGGIGASLAGGSSLVIFRNSKHKPEVWKLIEYLSEPEQQLELYQLTGDLPGRVEAWQDTALADNRYAAAFFEQLKHAVPTPKVPEWEQIAQKTREYVELISMNVLTVEKGLQELDRQVDVILEKRRWLVYGQ